MDPAGLVAAFRVRFGAAPRLFRAPGRVNLIGEHTDYNGGFVLPAAIDRETHVAAAPRADRRLVLRSLDVAGEREHDLEAPAPAARDWSTYVVGVARVLEAQGLRLPGADLMIAGDVPLGAGLSSSASLEVAAALALLGLAGAARDGVELARVCQAAENEHVGARCGIMDQFAAVHGRAGAALLLDCRTLAWEPVPLPAGVALVICNTMVKHTLAAGEYNVRRAECEDSVRRLARVRPGVRALRDLTPADLPACEADLAPALARRCRHVVTENARVLEAAAALRAGDLARLGALMQASHASLRDDYAVSCDELDAMVRAATATPGCLGARMTGGGFGGCTVNLVREDAVAAFRDAVTRRYRHETGIAAEVYVCRAAAGAGEEDGGG
ncbi:MAG TPA: galactokinase [Polyangia bacterium]